jgi:hypothetical protein
MTPEAKFNRRIDAFLSLNECFTYNINMLSQKGVPDRIGVCRGKFFAIEAKRSESEAMKKKDPTIALQHYNLERIAKHGGFAMMVYPQNFDSFKEKFLQYIGDKK